MPGLALAGGGPGQRLEKMIEQPGAQGFVHPVAGEEHVVDLVHALDVPRAVSLLGLQAEGWIWRRRRKTQPFDTGAPLFVFFSTSTSPGITLKS